MKLLTLISLLTSVQFCSAAAVPTDRKVTKPAAFFLAGDSTTAVINAAKTGGGWGNGFLATLKNGAIGFNFGHNGATTVSFRNGGDWANVLAGVAANKTKYTPFVTIQVRVPSRILGETNRQ
jgi:lysophospholipase L1-like esterase